MLDSCFSISAFFLVQVACHHTNNRTNDDDTAENNDDDSNIAQFTFYKWTMMTNSSFVLISKVEIIGISTKESSHFKLSFHFITNLLIIEVNKVFKMETVKNNFTYHLMYKLDWGTSMVN